MRAKRKPRARAAVALRLSAFALALWSTCMCCLTIATAQNLYELFYFQNEDFAHTVATHSRMDAVVEDDTGLPGFAWSRMLEALSIGSRAAADGAPQVSPNVLWQGDTIRFDSAAAIFDGAGNRLCESGNFLYFYYVTQDDWETETEEGPASGFSCVALSAGEADDLCARLRSLSQNGRSLPSLRAIKLTGSWDGARFAPVSAACITEEMVWQVLAPESASPLPDGSVAYPLGSLLRQGLLEWEPLFDRGETGPEEQTTIYAIQPQLLLYDPGAAFSYDGREYASLSALLAEFEPKPEEYYGQVQDWSRYGLTQTIQLGIHYIYDDTWEYSESDPIPARHYTLVTAIRSTPLSTAAALLWPVYLGTFLLAALGVLLLWRGLARDLIRPCQDIAHNAAGGWGCRWQEPAEALAQHRSARSQLLASQDEVTRLSTALDYAQSAEQARRRMTSDLAHELKTPLAIIHSYSEGLKAHIAEEKRERYLDTILAEAERMDTMVLEMLELSRLEAGKVKLTRAVFSLTELTRAVFARLELLAREKELEVTFDWQGDHLVNADEARISQAVTNLAANAVQYTPRGGHIRAAIHARQGSTCFLLENDCAPLSDEALAHLWDAFYRPDNARTGGGTGLGLAIAKSVITLHGGSCSARGTERGVEFCFTLPD